MHEPVQKYAGYKVVTINGKDAFQEIFEFARDKNHYSRDLGVRFNQAVQQAYFLRQLATDEMPAAENVNLVLESPEGGQETVTFKWIAASLGVGYSSDSAFLAACQYSTTSGNDAQLAGSEQLTFEKFYSTLSTNEQKVVDLLQDQRPWYQVRQELWKLANFAETKEVKPRAITALTTVFNGVYMSLYKAASLPADVGALHIRSFSPPQNGIQAFMEEMNTALKAGANNGVKRLIIDTRGNTGGYICLGFTLARFISHGIPGYSYPNYDLIESDYMKSAYGCSGFPASSSFYDINHNPVVDGDWYTKNT